MKICIYIVVLIIALLGFYTPATALDWNLELESGLVFSGLNDVQVPNESGTRFSLVNDLSSETKFYSRIRLNLFINPKHTISILAAPLRIRGDGTFNQTVVYNTVEFPSDQITHSFYRFDSYRLTYSYRFYNSDKLSFRAGLTAKLRDAEIELKSGEISTTKSNTGFVPLIHFDLNWSLQKNLAFQFRGDALAAPQGRAEDVLAALYYQAWDDIAVRLGYRLLEGGADVDEVYNFALLHYLSFTVIITL